MLKIFIFFFFLITVGLNAGQVIYLEQNIQSSGMNINQPVNVTTKSWISDDNVRIEQPGQVLLIQFEQQKIYTLMMKEKEYIEMTFADMDNILSLSNMFMQPGKMPENFVKTGQQEKIQSWQAYLVEAKNEEQYFRIWLCPDIKIERQKLFKMYSKMPGLSALVTMLEKAKEFPGFPVLSEMDMKFMGTPVKTRVELLKAGYIDFDSDLFALPGGFKKIDNPLKSMDKQE